MDKRCPCFGDGIITIVSLSIIAKFISGVDVSSDLVCYDWTNFVGILF